MSRLRRLLPWVTTASLLTAPALARADGLEAMLTFIQSWLILLALALGGLALAAFFRMGVLGLLCGLFVLLTGFVLTSLMAPVGLGVIVLAIGGLAASLRPRSRTDDRDLSLEPTADQSAAR